MMQLHFDCISWQIRLFCCQRGIEDWGNCPVCHLLAANNPCDFKQGVGDPPHYTMENKWRPLRHLPAITENRCCDLTGQRARGPRFMANIRVVWVAVKLSTAHVPGRLRLFLAFWDTRYLFYWSILLSIHSWTGWRTRSITVKMSYLELELALKR